MLAKIDIDGDGSVSRAEFVVGRPDGVGEDQAGSLFDSIDPESAGALTSDQLREGMDKNRPAPPPHGMGGPGGPGGAESADDSGLAASSSDLLPSRLVTMESYQRSAAQNSAAQTSAISASLSV
jgi:hypothetical protein